MHVTWCENTKKAFVNFRTLAYNDDKKSTESESNVTPEIPNQQLKIGVLLLLAYR